MLAKLVVVGAILAMGTSEASVGQVPAGAEEAAQKAAESWLALIDGEKFAASWEQASTAFKGAVSADQWAAAVSKARGPYGAFKSRAVKSRQFTTSLPGAPDGKYVVVTFETAFEKKAAAVETVMMMLDSDSAWRVAGSFIR
jgi:Protein of unknown function (DUF4019)